MLKKFLTLILIVTIGSALLAQTPKPETTQYTCVMHPEVVRDYPGKCPKCGMELVPAKQITNIQHRTPNIQRPSQRRLTETPNTIWRDELRLVQRKRRRRGRRSIMITRCMK